MKLSIEGFTLIQHYESCKLSAYPDPASPLGIECVRKKTTYLNVPNWQKLSGSPWTIGWGHTGKDVIAGKKITQQEANELMAADVSAFDVGVSKLVSVITPPISQKQFDALVSFAFNVGLTAFAGSTLLKMLVAKNYTGAADQFLRWNKAGGKVLNGLTKRRHAERALFLGVSVEGAIHAGETAV